MSTVAQGHQPLSNSHFEAVQSAFAFCCVKGTLCRGLETIDFDLTGPGTGLIFTARNVRFAGEQAASYTTLTCSVNDQTRTLAAATQQEWTTVVDRMPAWHNSRTVQNSFNLARRVIAAIHEFSPAPEGGEANLRRAVHRESLPKIVEHLNRVTNKAQQLCLTAVFLRTFMGCASTEYPARAGQMLQRALELVREAQHGRSAPYQERRGVLGDSPSVELGTSEMRRRIRTDPYWACYQIVRAALGLRADGAEGSHRSAAQRLLKMSEAISRFGHEDLPVANRLNYSLFMGLRHALGDPYKVLPSFAPAWRNEEVLGLARKMDRTKDFSELGALADELEDLGCMDADIIGHCRGPRPVEASWVVSKVLEI